MRGSVTQHLILSAPQAEVYSKLQDMSRYGVWMRDVRHVTMHGPRKATWAVAGPDGMMEWNAEITIERPPDGFAFCTTGADTSGFTRIKLRAVDERTTELKIQRFLGIRPGPRAGRLKAWYGDPRDRLRSDLGHLAYRIDAVLEDQGAGRPLAIGFTPMTTL